MLTNKVKEYIEQNHELLDTDEGIVQLIDNYPDVNSVGNLFDVLRHIGLLTNYESLCDSYIKEMRKQVLNSATGIKIEPVIVPVFDGKSFPHRIQMSIDNNIDDHFRITLKNGDTLISDNSRAGMFIQRGANTSGGISPGSKIIEHRLFISELQNKNKIQRIISDADYYVQKFDDAFSRCLDSFKYKEEATKIIDSILPRLNELMTSILGYSKIIFKHEEYWNNFHVQGKSKTGTIIDLVSIDYTDPVADESVLLSEAENALKRYKIEYDRNQARKAAKQAALAADPNKKIITRKEVNQAISASGVNVRTDFVYTNKHKTITTYKYAFNNLTQDECNKIKEELVNIGAHVKDVTCEQGWWGGRGAYMSLFIRLYN